MDRHRVESSPARHVRGRHRRHGPPWRALATGICVLAISLVGLAQRGPQPADTDRLHVQATGPSPDAPISVGRSPTTAPSSAPAAPDRAVRGTGTFTAAPGGTAPVGTGRLISYRVEVENGSGQDPVVFAATVDAILADQDGWTADRRWSLRRVSGPRADLVIRLATPPTVDRVCASLGLDTAGYASCRAGPYAMINLTRWLRAVPEYRGDLALYRRYVINHEVGHRLGHGHELCPGRARLAPVMQQQTYGLKRLPPQRSPYLTGRYIGGPPTSQN